MSKDFEQPLLEHVIRISVRSKKARQAGHANSLKRACAHPETQSALQHRLVQTLAQYMREQTAQRGGQNATHRTSDSPLKNLQLQHKGASLPPPLFSALPFFANATPPKTLNVKGPNTSAHTSMSLSFSQPPRSTESKEDVLAFSLLTHLVQIRNGAEVMLEKIISSHATHHKKTETSAILVLFFHEKASWVQLKNLLDTHLNTPDKENEVCTQSLPVFEKTFLFLEGWFYALSALQKKGLLKEERLVQHLLPFLRRIEALCIPVVRYLANKPFCTTSTLAAQHPTHTNHLKSYEDISASLRAIVMTFTPIETITPSFKDSLLKRLKLFIKSEECFENIKTSLLLFIDIALEKEKLINGLLCSKSQNERTSLLWSLSVTWPFIFQKWKDVIKALHLYIETIMREEKQRTINESPHFLSLAPSCLESLRQILNEDVNLIYRLLKQCDTNLDLPSSSGA